MSNLPFDSFLDRLKAVCVHASHSHEEMVHLLAEFHGGSRAIRQWCEARVDELTQRGRVEETSTHYKWLLWTCVSGAYRVYIHQYKSTADRTVGYALSVHNHRYWFASHVLQGGFRHLKFRIDDVEGTKFDVQSVQIAENSFLRVGSTYQLNVGEIHSLSELQEDTFTLIVQGSPERAFSETFDLTHGSVRRVVPKEGQILTMLNSLGHES